MKTLAAAFAQALLTALGDETGRALGKRLGAWIHPTTDDDETEDEGEGVE